MKIYYKTLATIAISAMLSACSANSESADNQEINDSTTTKAEELPKIDIKQVSYSQVAQDNEYTATVEADNINNISPSTPNRIKSITVDVGDNVAKGQTLVTLDATNVDQLKVRLNHAKIEYNRALNLLEIGAGTQQAVDAAKTEVDALTSQYNNVVENTVLKSPISGVVTARNYDPGDMTGGSPILTIGQLSPSVNVMIYVTETDYAKIKRGMGVEVKFDVYHNETFAGTITKVHPTVDSKTRTFGVEVSIANRNQKVKPGMFARVLINLGSAKHVVVPDRAVVKQAGSGNKYVYVYNNGVVSYNKVELGQRIDDSYEVISGVADGDFVVITGQHNLKHGARAEVINRDARSEGDDDNATETSK